MSCILHIETSTEACSVAVSEDGLAVFSKEDLKGLHTPCTLGVFVDEALSFVDSHGMPLDAVAVSCGSRLVHRAAYWCFYGRKGICYGRNLPLSRSADIGGVVCAGCCYIMICLRMPCSVL